MIWSYIENFEPYDFDTKDYRNPRKRVWNSGKENMDPGFVALLDIFASRHNCIITSGYRSPEWNEAVGGSPNSYHVKGKAADILIGNNNKDAMVEDARLLGFKGIGIYDKHIHLDNRDGEGVTWFG